jgi:NAD(P)-dependent dehydrogenase (short-subunit alcohol dehydrogenase family)
MELNGIAAVVTGGASGLGEGVARAFIGAGARVALFDLNEERGMRLAADIGATFCRVDVGDSASVAAGFAMAREVQGQERILVNCAGMSVVSKTAFRARDTGDIAHFPFDGFEKTIRINLLGTFYCIALSVAGMMTLEPLEDGERGAIVNTASIAAVEGQAGQAAYSASKNGILGMTLPIARDLMNEGIRVNSILPGSFDTPLLATAPQKIFDALVAAVPFPKRLGKVEEFASLVLEMCRNRYLNGENVRLDGAARLATR